MPLARSPFLVFPALVALGSIAPAQATTARVSVSSLGEQANAPCLAPQASGDGRFVVFVSSASNLVPADQNGVMDAFLHDRSSGRTYRLGTAIGGAEPNGSTTLVAISTDGHFAAIASDASNLVPGDANGRRDVFLIDRHTGSIELVSRNNAGAQGNWNSGGGFGWSDRLALSDDGRFVAFTSDATNLGGPARGLFVRDRATATTVLVSQGPLGLGTGALPSIRADGSIVAFVSFDTLSPDDYDSDSDAACYCPLDIYTRDLLSGTTSLVSHALCGADWPSLSANGGVLAYGLSPLSSPGLCDSTRAIGVGFGPIPPEIGEANGLALTPSASDSGLIAFSSSSTTLVTGDTNGVSDIFVGGVSIALQRVSVGTGSIQANGGSSFPAISRSGEVIVFVSAATNLVAGDTNNCDDIFVFDFASCPPFDTFFRDFDGDGYGDPAVAQASCFLPAGFVANNLDCDDASFAVHPNAAELPNGIDDDCNGLVDDDLVHSYCIAKVNSQGCTPYVGFVGTQSASGPDDFHVTAANVRNNSPGLMFWGTARDSVPFGGGVRCVRAPIIRTPVQFSGGSSFPDCSGTYSFHFSHSYMAAYLVTPGTTVCAQWWQRDAPHPDGTGQGLTNALEFTVTP